MHFLDSLLKIFQVILFHSVTTTPNVLRMHPFQPRIQIST